MRYVPRIARLYQKKTRVSIKRLSFALHCAGSIHLSGVQQENAERIVR
ncbi:hypothetical protein HMPREF9193_01129 [Treponema lecithinolyticum ATCC 700332]|uniref:Uncharacterized protein n=1 Tax=Treponema lecithinolyticum ATCC 700332 TaxID=1321815 RepID=A0ABN0NYP9_TRELE|nr:hypothetical protein HMPREF9193_01129 [Treponema lecithinolyticum ATCC 700332]